MKLTIEQAKKIAMENYDDYPNSDPCFGCQVSSSYACKRCPYGDDGHYSVYDVYTPSELGISVKW